MVAGLEDLPRNWLKVPLALITKEFISGGTPSTKRKDMWDGSIPWTTSASIDEDAVVLEEGQRLITERALADSATNLVPTGNLLIGTRVGVGKAVVNLVDIAISQDLTGLVVDHHIVDPVFVAYQFKTERIKEFFLTRIRGTTIKGISRFDLQSLELLLPPIDEQRAIVSCLDQVRAAIRTRRRELALERERKAALLEYLFTHGTRGEPTKQTEIGEMPESWQVVRLGEIAKVQSGVTLGRRYNGASTVRRPYLRVANVLDGRLDLSDIKEVEVLESEVDRYLLRSGDVLLTEGGDEDKLGRGFIWEGQIPGCLHQNHIFAVRTFRDVLDPEYLVYLIQSSYGRSYFLSVAHRTTNLASINSTKLKAFPVIVPDLKEQRAIVEVLRRCDVKMAALERDITVHQELFDRLLEDLMTGRLPVPAS